MSRANVEKDENQTHKLGMNKKKVKSSFLVMEKDSLCVCVCE